VEFEFSGPVWEWRGPSPFHFVTVPEDESALLNAASAAITYGWGMIPVEAQIGRSRWSTSLFPKDGGYVVPLKSVIRKAQNLALGDTVSVILRVNL
jgi:hypothetical protein